MSMHAPVGGERVDPELPGEPPVAVEPADPAETPAETPVEPGRPEVRPTVVDRPGFLPGIKVPVKHFGDAHLEFMPPEDQNIVARMDDAWLTYHLDPTDENKEALEVAKVALQERRKFWREIGQLTGARPGIVVLNYTHPEGS